MRYIPMESPMMMMQPVLVNPPRRFGHAELAVSGLALPPNVIRMPRGPDKGKGFARWCNSRMKPGSPGATAPTAAPAPGAGAAGAPTGQQKQQQPLPQRKSRAIPIVAPPEVHLSAVLNFLIQKGHLLSLSINRCHYSAMLISILGQHFHSALSLSIATQVCQLA